MQWQEVRTIFPDQYVLLEVLDSHTEDNIQYVDDVAIVRAIQNPSEATKELLKCKTSMTILNKGCSLTVDHLIIDTGSLSS